jgi:hypothetical protein
MNDIEPILRLPTFDTIPFLCFFLFFFPFFVLISFSVFSFYFFLLADLSYSLYCVDCRVLLRPDAAKLLVHTDQISAT